MGYEVLTGEMTTKITVIHPEEGGSECTRNKLNVIIFLKTQI
jgi:hypothetical protein